MTDRLSPERRSALMRSVKGRDTKPEIAVRKAVHREGYRYRLHGRHLPGTPDLVFPARNAILFVHGCFWHGHYGCSKATIPKTRTSFWTEKIAANQARDKHVQCDLRSQGWRTLVVWECETRNIKHLLPKVRRFLGLKRQKR